jgi:hypothetical protein
LLSEAAVTAASEFGGNNDVVSTADESATSENPTRSRFDLERKHISWKSEAKSDLGAVVRGSETVLTTRFAWTETIGER